MAENILGVLESAEPDEPRIWKRALTRRNKAEEEKTYYRWYCSWHDGKKTVRVHLESCSKMSEAQAIEKAKKLQAGVFQDAEAIDGQTSPNPISVKIYE